MGQISIDFQNKDSINAEYTKLILNEYMSKPFKAVLDCNINKQSANSKCEFISNPLSYINEYVYIKVFQKYSNNSSSYRYISGKITNILYKGISKKDDKNNTYLYEITIQPPFVELMKTRKSKSYLYKNIKDIIKEILDENNIGNYDLNYIDENNLIKRCNKILIHQHNETDYEFLMRLLLFYGINYYFIHINKNSKDKTTLKFINGTFPDVQFMKVENDNRLINKLYLNLDDNDKSAGVFNNVTMNYNTNNIDNTNNGISLHGFGYGNNTENIIQECQDKEDISKNIYAALSYKKNTINLSSTYICASINSKLNIKGYMPDESTANDMYLIKSVTTVYNNGSNEKDNIDIYGFFPDDTKKNNGIICEEIENTAVLYFDNNMSSDISLVANNIDDTSSVSNKIYRPHSMLLQAVVCDKDGNTDISGISIPESCDKNSPNQFYAKLKNDDNKTRIINMVMPYGAKNYYTYVYPDIGSEILVFKDSNDKYYLFGYIPNISPIISNQGSLKHSYLFTGSPGENYISFDNNSKNHIKDLIHSATIDSFMKQAYIQTNITCIQYDYENEKNMYNVNGVGKTLSVKEWCAALKTKYDEEINAKSDNKNKLEELQKNIDKNEDQINTLKQDIDNSEKNIQTIESEISKAEAKIIGIFNNAKANIDNDKERTDKETLKTKIDNYLTNSEKITIHSNTVDTSAKDNVNIKSGKSLNLFSNTNGIEISSDNDSINITANKAIKLSVGANSIQIDRDKIALISRKWVGTPGATDSSIFLKSISGVSISGLQCSMNGLFSSSMSDSFGGLIRTYLGSSSILGYKAGIYTIRGAEAIAKASLNGVKLITHLASIYNDEKFRQGMNYTNYFADLIGHDLLIGAGFKTWKMYDKGQPKNAADWFLLVMECLDMVWTVCDRVVTIMELEDPDFMHDEASPNSKASVRDALRLFLMTTKIVLATSIFITSLVKISDMRKSGHMEIAGPNRNAVLNKDERVVNEINDANSAGASYIPPQLEQEQQPQQPQPQQPQPDGN